MLFIALSILIFSNIAPRWILKSKYQQLHDAFSWKFSVFKLSGLVTCFLLSVIIITTTTLTDSHHYVTNKNAIYGLLFSKTMKEVGFVNGDKVITINNKEVDRVTDIMPQIILESGEVNIKISRNGKIQDIIFSEEVIKELIRSGDIHHIGLIMHPDSDSTSVVKEVIVSEESYGMTDVFVGYADNWKYMKSIVLPQKILYGQLPGYVTIGAIRDLRGYFLLLAMILVLMTIISLIPLPGFNCGNFMISIIENIRKKQFNARIIRIAQISCISLFIVFELIIIYV